MNFVLSLIPILSTVGFVDFPSGTCLANPMCSGPVPHGGIVPGKLPLLSDKS